jgi:hypothetical protein
VWVVVGGVALLGLLQLVPYGWWHVNPPVTADAPWPDAASAALARQACYDCHSNETDWPLYSYVAPMSWLVRADVQAGRNELNFSKWDEYRDEADDAAEEVSRGAMPPDRYTRLHPDAKLSDEEVATLVAALEAMDEGAGRGGGDGGGDDDDHGGPGPG